jgi:hypothetical protein
LGKGPFDEASQKRISGAFCLCAWAAHKSGVRQWLPLLLSLLLDKPWGLKHNQPLSPGRPAKPPAQSPDPKEAVYDHPFRTLGRRSRTRHRRVRRDARGHTCACDRHDTARWFKCQQRVLSSRQFAPIAAPAGGQCLQRAKESRLGSALTPMEPNVCRILCRRFDVIRDEGCEFPPDGAEPRRDRGRLTFRGCRLPRVR